MSRVSQQNDQGTDTPRQLNAGWRGLAFAAVALLAGPGFFTLALFTALYRDVSHESAGPQGRGVIAVVADRTGGRLLSPVSERIAPRIEPASPSAGADTTPASPVLRYLKITGTAEYSAMPVRSETTENGWRATFRTVCVRLCDGSYFPVGYAATAEQFAAHEAQCQSRCGSPARLYVYANGTQTPLQMRSLSGEAYLELETAFLFQTSYDAQCSCRSQPWTVASRQRHQQYAALAAAEAKSSSVLENATIAVLTSPVQLAQSATIAGLSALEEAVTIADRAPTMVLTQESNPPTLNARAADKSEIASLAAQQHKADRLAAVSERSDFIAMLELPRLATVTAGPARQRREVAASRQPAKPVPFSLVSFVPAASPFNKAKKTVVAVAAADVSAIRGRRGQRSATDILMRNLNPHN